MFKIRHPKPPKHLKTHQIRDKSTNHSKMPKRAHKTAHFTSKRPTSTGHFVSTATLRASLHEAPMDQALFAQNPMQQFHKWFGDVCHVNPIMPERMSISTIKKLPNSNHLIPSSRPVLLKDMIIQDRMISPYGIINPIIKQEKYPDHVTTQWFSPPNDQNFDGHVDEFDYDNLTDQLLHAGGFTFVTNYTSNKAHQIAENPYCSLTFHWVELERVVRVEGFITRVPYHLSTLYHEQRPYFSRISALTSDQSKPIENYELLQERYNHVTELVESREFAQLGFRETDPALRQIQNTPQNDQFVPKPTNWGGYVIIPHEMEFWQGKPSRFHQRILYTRTDTINENNEYVWNKQYLQP